MKPILIETVPGTLPSPPLQVREHFLPPLLDAILVDYRRNVPEAREPEVLSTVMAIVDKLEVRGRETRSTA